MTTVQGVALTLAPAISGFLSVIGSSWLIWMLVRTANKNNSDGNKLQHVKYRLLLGLSVTDLIFSLAIIPWALYIPESPERDVWGAMGNERTCAAQGFLIQLGHMSSFYQAGLSHYFYSTIVHGVSARQFRKSYERKIHAFAIIWPLGTAVAALLLDLYHPMSIGCWIATVPLGCSSLNGECEKGKWAPLYAYLFAGIPVALFMVYIAYTMYQIYLRVMTVSRKAQTRRLASVNLSSQYSNINIEHQSTALPNAQANDTNDATRNVEVTSNELMTNSTTATSCTNNQCTCQEDQSITLDQSAKDQSVTDASFKSQRKRSRSTTVQTDVDQSRIRSTAVQAFLYVLAYSATHTFVFLAANLDYWAPKGSPFAITLLGTFTFPLQGILNVFVFLRPKIQLLRAQDETLSYWKAVYRASFQ